MQRSHRTLFRVLIAGLFVLSAVILTISPTRYKVDLDSLVAIWGDVIRDLDSVVKTVRISTELEIEFGDAIADSNWLDAGGDADQAYVTNVGEKIAAQARRQDLTWTFHVVYAEYPNAWAILGGHVYITTAMLALIESEAELAAILGHEIAHVDLHHCVDRVQNRMILERVGMGSVGFVLSMAEDFLRVGYGEVQEDEADRYGMLLASNAGYNPLNAFDMFHKFYLEEEAASARERPSGGPEGEILSSLSEFLGDYFDTHPEFSDRLDTLRFLLDTNARAWDERVFRIGKTAYVMRDADLGRIGASESWVFSEGDADYLALRTELAHLLGRDVEAQEFLDRFLFSYPEDARGERLLALLSREIEVERSDTPAPVTRLPGEAPADQASPADTRSVDTIRKLHHAGSLDEAEAMALELLALGSEEAAGIKSLFAEIRYDKGLALFADDDFKKAIAAFDAAEAGLLELLTDDTEEAKSRNLLALVRYQRGRSYQEDDRPKLALASYNLALLDVEELLRPDGQDVEAEYLKTRILYRRGRSLESLDRLREALADYTATVERPPNNRFAQHRLGIVARNLGEYRLAVRAYEAALALKPDYPHVLNEFAWLRLTAGLLEFRDPVQALEFARKAVEIEANSLRLDTLGAALIAARDADGALDAYNRAADMSAEYRSRLADDLIYLECLPENAGNATIEDLELGLRTCIAKGWPPFVLSEAIERIEKIADSKPERARRELQSLTESFPDHPEVVRVTRYFE